MHRATPLLFTFLPFTPALAAALCLNDSPAQTLPAHPIPVPECADASTPGLSIERGDSVALVLGPIQSSSQTVFSGRVFFDHSEDGIWNPQLDPLELPIQGWRVELKQNGVLLDVAFSDVNGDYSFTRDLDGSAYSFRQVAPGGYIGEGKSGAIWLATTPREFAATASLPQVQLADCGDLSFELVVGAGFNKKFWHGPKGAQVLQAADPAWRENLTYWNGTPLCLRRNISSYDPNVSIYKPLPLPANFELARLDFSRWIASPHYGHAGFMLSVQVATTILNLRYGRMQFTAYVDRFQDGVLVSIEDMISGAQKMLLCDPGAGMTGPHDPEQELRALILGCINEFGTINNSGDPAAPQTVYGPARAAAVFPSPY